MPFLAPLVGAITTAIGSIGIVGQLALGLGLQFVAAKIEKSRAKKAQQQAGGVQFERQYGENVPRQVACGRIGIAGHDCYVNTYGNANNVLQQVYAFSDFPCDGLAKVWADGKELNIVDFGGGYYKVVGGDYDEIVAFQWYDGTQTAASGPLVANSNPSGRWTSDHVGTGICYLIVFLTYQKDRLNQPPEFFFELRGARLYDPRKDSTAGGAGAHRWGNYSTYEFTENPVVMEYNYRRGFAVNGDLFLGMGMPASDLPVDRYAIAANICDESTPDGPRYRCSVIFNADVEHGDNIDAVMQACGGIVVDGVDGSWPLIGTDQPIVETITDDDLIGTEPVRYQRYRSMADLVNSVQGTYPEPANMWSPVGYDAQSSASQVALDRRTRDFKLDFQTVPYKPQANQLAAIYYKENRFEGTAEIVVRPRFQTVRAGDWIRWNSELYGDRTWMVSSRAIKALSSDGPRNVVLSLVERGGSIYDAVGVLPPTVPFPPGEPIYINALPDFAVIPVYATGADGRRYPAFRVSWSAIPDATIEAAELHWRAASDPDTTFTRIDQADALYAFVQEGILGGTEYEFGYRLLVVGRTAPGVVGWVTATSLPADAIGLDQLQEEIREALEKLRDWIDADTIDGLVQQTEELAEQLGEEQSARVDGAIEASDRFRSLVDEITALRDRAMEADFADYQAREEIKRSLTVSIETYAASFDERIVVAASDIASVAQRTTTLEASSVELAAQISAVDIARIEGENALAYQMSLLSAGTDNQFDPYKFWGFAGDFEGWTGNGAPTIADGYLRPADHATDPYVTSPSGLAVVTASYRQVRARVRKYGAPVWEGQCWWAAIAEVWDAGRRTTIAEPAFDGNGIGLLTWSPEWSGSIDRIRIDLSAAQTATDYYTIDWISVGAPAPGASRAELAAERQARIDGDSANASDILALETRATDIESGVSGLSTAVSALETEVSTLGDTVTATGNALDALALEVADKAELDVVNAMSAEITALGSGLLNQGSMVSAIRGSLLPSAMEGVDQDFAQFLGGQKAAGALAEASRALNTRIDLTNASLTIVAEAVTQVQAVIPSLATASGLNALTSRVTAAEGAITANSSAITVINTALPGKASTSSVTALEGRVSTAEGNISANTSAISSINAELPDKADASALDSLSATVSDLDGVVSAQATAITGLEANVGDLSASARVKIEVVAGPAGYSRIGWMARTGTAEDFRTGGIYLDVPTNAALPVEVIVDASRLAVVNGATKKVPFVIDAGKIYLSADVYIERAIVGDLVVGTHNIELGAVTVMDLADGYGVTLGTSSGDYRTLAAIAIEHVLGSPKVRIDWTTIRGSPVEYRIRNATTGVTFFTYQMGNPGAAGTLAWSSFHQDVPPAHIATSVYLIEGWTPMGAGVTHPFAAISAITLKR